MKGAVTRTIGLTACLLAGCGASGQMMSGYTDGERTVVPTTDKRETEIKDLEVWFHPSTPNTAAVWPHNFMSIVLWTYEDSRWLARVDEHRATYSAALLSALKQRGKTCHVEGSDPFPEGYAIEFTYSCEQ